jgi:hypothetical protein
VISAIAAELSKARLSDAAVKMCVVFIVVLFVFV